MRPVLFLIFATAAAVAQPPRQLPWEKNNGNVGLALYRENCVVCHDIDKPQSESKKLGPSFHELFRKQKMPLANQAPNRAYIAVRVRFGGPLMPAFAKKMTEAEINTLLDFMESYTRERRD